MLEWEPSEVLAPVKARGVVSRPELERLAAAALRLTEACARHPGRPVHAMKKWRHSKASPVLESLVSPCEDTPLGERCDHCKRPVSREAALTDSGKLIACPLLP